MTSSNRRLWHDVPVLCSIRPLHNAFKTFRQKSPMAMLRDVRLEGAHDDLQAGESTITEIAFKWGFSNPGRFSRLYAEKFGCKPSQTLRYSYRSSSTERSPARVRRASGSRILQQTARSRDGVDLKRAAGVPRPWTWRPWSNLRST
ncbi:MAG: helix-turn-helix transcriptional regulator [Rhizobiales bacterium]|nr:helix-turn-helix transcriptional regulator [Hyphomicrobiales bacterium]